MKRCLRWAAAGVAVLMVAGAAWAQEGNELASLLTANPWCSFRHDKDTGLSSTVRYRFLRDGTYETGASSEARMSGEAGSFTSRRNRTSAGTWQVKRSALFFTVNGVTQEPVSLALKVNENGIPVIIAGGVELTPCE